MSCPLFKRIFIPWGIVSWWRCPRSLLSKESFALGMPLLSLQRILTRETEANFPNRIVPSLLESSVLCLLWSILSFYWAWCGMGILPKLKERNSLSIADACGHLPDTIHASSPINLVLCAKRLAFKVMSQIQLASFLSQQGWFRQQQIRKRDLSTSSRPDASICRS